MDRKSTLSKPTKKDLEYINSRKKNKIVFEDIQDEYVQDEFDFDLTQCDSSFDESNVEEVQIECVQQEFDLD